MKATRLAITLSALLLTRPALALEIEFNVDGGAPELTIQDNGANDLNKTTGEIDFSGSLLSLASDGRVEEFTGPIGNSVTLTARRVCVGGTKNGKPCDDNEDNCPSLPDSCDCPHKKSQPAATCSVGGEATFHNTYTAAHTLQVTARSTFADRGPPLG